MDFTQFISYLDYGVLGLSAIILILSFVLLSREQKRDIFRPEVEKAIRRYMMLALAFAGVGLVATITDGVFVTPAKAEKERQAQRMDLLSNMISEEMARRMLEQNGEISGIKNVEPLIEPGVGDSVVIDTIAAGTKPAVNPKEAKYQKVKEDVFLSFYNFRADKELFEKSLDKLGKENKEIAEEKAHILGDYDDLAKLKKEWLEKTAIPAMKESIEKGNKNPKVIVDLPSELTQSTTVPKKVVVSDLDMLESELELLKLPKKK